MVQPIDFTKPIYNGVNISIRRPEVIAGAEKDGVTNPMAGNNNGIYNAVNIDVDNPKVSPKETKIYDNVMTLYAELPEILADNDCIMLKASHSTNLHKIIEKMKENG